MRHIALVDDDQELHALLTMRLSAAGYRVSSFANAARAVAGIDDTVDAVLLDVHLPDMDGMFVLRALMKSGIEAPIVMLSAHATIELAVEAVQLGASGFLTKPFGTDELLATVEEATTRGALARRARTWRRMLEEQPFQPIGESASMVAIRELVARVAPTSATVLITGESGTGKELLARAIHAQSPRAQRRFVAVNCAAVPEHLIEAEIFGHARGAFSDAHKDREGLLAAAEGSTLFLDEIGDAPQSLQAKLLRVLEERAFRPIGSDQTIRADIRVIAATNRDPSALVAAGRMRQDLLFRLRVVPVHLPPLRERRDDIPLLAAVLNQMAAERHNLAAPRLTSSALSALEAHDWPGNVRELANVVERSVLYGKEISGGDFETAPPAQEERTSETWDELVERIGDAVPPLREARAEFERAYVRQVLRRTQGNVSAAARIAHRNRSEFYEIMKRHRITLNRRGISE